jgi:hypothetical protein
MKKILLVIIVCAFFTKNTHGQVIGSTISVTGWKLVRIMNPDAFSGETESRYGQICELSKGTLIAVKLLNDSVLVKYVTEQKADKIRKCPCNTLFFMGNSEFTSIQNKQEKEKIRIAKMELEKQRGIVKMREFLKDTDNTSDVSRTK